MAVAQQPQDLPQDMQRFGTTTATLTIPKRVGHRRILTDYFVKAGASSFSDIKINNVTLARIFDNLAQAKLVAGVEQKFGQYGFLYWLSTIIPDFPFFNAAQDEDVIIARNAAPTRIDAYFRDQTEGDVKDFSSPGMSKGKKHLFILNMSNSLASTVTGVLKLDQQDMPQGLTMFTDGTRMSANNRYTLYALAGNFPINVGSKTTRVHMFDEFTELFTSENSEGLLVDPAAESDIAFALNPLKAFVLPTPYVLNPNKVLTMRIDVTDDGANHLAAGSQQLFLIGVRELLAP